MVYANMLFPYLAVYSNKDGEFKLLNEYKGEEDYSITDNNLILNRKRNGMAEMALTKDYIVTLQRDYLTDDIDESTVGRDFNKLPKSLFVYDYDTNLIKIIDFGLPILRISANQKENIVYAIVIDSDFVLMKYEI